MSFKKFSSAQGAPGKDSANDKAKDTPATNQPATESETSPAEVAPAPKT
jgi:hypothetical protein